jgi:pteridine reductase
MDIARTVLFLVRDAGYISGQVIAVDGGRSVVA